MERKVRKKEVHRKEICSVCIRKGWRDRERQPGGEQKKTAEAAEMCESPHYKSIRAPSKGKRAERAKRAEQARAERRRLEGNREN